MRAAWFAFCCAIVLAAPAPVAQQANHPEASLIAQGQDFGTGPMRVRADSATGLEVVIGSGIRPHAPFLLAAGPLASAGTPLPPFGLLDLVFGQGSPVIVADGFTGQGLSPIFDALAFTDSTGRYTGIFPLLDYGVDGPAPFAWQALVEDPSAPGGARFTAAMEVEVRIGDQARILSIPRDDAVTIAWPSGSAFPFYGSLYTELHIAENGLIGFSRPGADGRQELAALTNTAATPFGPPTYSAAILGTDGLPAPPTIGFFEDLDLLNGGSVRVHETARLVHLGFYDAPVRGTTEQSSFSITLWGTASPYPGRITISLIEGSSPTPGDGRVFGLSPGGDGQVSFSPTNALTDFSRSARVFTGPFQNLGFISPTSGQALIESFDFRWLRDPSNPLYDLSGETFDFDPDPMDPLRYSVRARNEIRLSLESVSPIAGPQTAGTLLTIKGRGFRDDGTMSASLGGFPLQNLTIIDAETLTATTPAVNSPGLADLEVALGARGTSARLAGAWTWTPNQRITPLPLTDEEVATYVLDPQLYGSVTLYGQTWTSMQVCANGLIVFSASPISVPLFVSSPASWDALDGIVVAPLWNDLCGDAQACQLPSQGSVVVTETDQALEIRWSGFYQWPNLAGPLGFSVRFERFGDPILGVLTSVVFDYQGGGTPDHRWSQIAGRSGILVGLRGPAMTMTTTALDLLSYVDPQAGIYGASITSPTADNLVHWIASLGYTGPVPFSAPANTWRFGSAAAQGPLGNTGLAFLATDPQALSWSIAWR